MRVLIVEWRAKDNGFGLYKVNIWANTKCGMGQDILMLSSCSGEEESFICSK